MHRYLTKYLSIYIYYVDKIFNEMHKKICIHNKFNFPRDMFNVHCRNINILRVFTEPFDCETNVILYDSYRTIGHNGSFHMVIHSTWSHFIHDQM